LGSEAAAVVARFYEAFDDGDVTAAVALADDALEMMDPGLGTVQGQGPFRDYLATLKRAVPDAKAVIERTTMETDDTVVVEGRFVGTFTGPLASPDGDIDPNGAAVDLSFADVSTVRNAKLVSYRTYYDQLGLLTQLGPMEG
jgi:ketosteroid isomerase-like protein